MGLSRAGGWFTTATGRRLYVLDPDSSQVAIEDIAHALSHLCRWGGHVLTFYSVAEHCLRASSLVPREDALHALLHDATEAYLGDVITPLKRILPDYQELEMRWWLAIADALHISQVMPPSVKVADRQLLELERRDLVSLSVEVDREEDGRWIAEVSEIPGALAYGETEAEAARGAKAVARSVFIEPPVGPKIIPLTSAEAKSLYLLRFNALTKAA